tara:strand:- start:4736 stop:5101 length:366 start_codon:yes stop_codon:yes gene_type:complete
MAISKISESNEYSKIYNSFNWRVNHHDNIIFYTDLLTSNEIKLRYLETEVTQQVLDYRNAYDQFMHAIMHAYLSQDYYTIPLTNDYKEALKDVLLNGLKEQSLDSMITLNYNRLYLIGTKL